MNYLNFNIEDIKGEVWRPINEYEELYEVSSHGRIKHLKKYIIHPNGGSSLRKEKIMRQAINKAGYHHISLTKNNMAKNYFIHRLVCLAFNLNEDNKPEVNHKDTNKSNNFYKNLEWATPLENSSHATLHGLLKPRFGKDNNFFGKHGGLSAVSKPVLQKSLDGKEISKWDSITEAAAHVKVSICCISECCNGRQKTSGGFSWQYLN